MPLWIVLVLAYLFEFANGWTDAPNSIATVVSTRVLRPLTAVAMAGVLNLVGALSGTAVAKTIAAGIVDPTLVEGGGAGLSLVAAVLLVTGFGLRAAHADRSSGRVSGSGFGKPNDEIIAFALPIN